METEKIYPKNSDLNDTEVLNQNNNLDNSKNGDNIDLEQKKENQ